MISRSYVERILFDYRVTKRNIRLVNTAIQMNRKNIGIRTEMEFRGLSILAEIVRLEADGWKSALDEYEYVADKVQVFYKETSKGQYSIVVIDPIDSPDIEKATKPVPCLVWVITEDPSMDILALVDFIGGSQSDLSRYCLENPRVAEYITHVIVNHQPNTPIEYTSWILGTNLSSYQKEMVQKEFFDRFPSTTVGGSRRRSTQGGTYIAMDTLANGYLTVSALGPNQPQIYEVIRVAEEIKSALRSDDPKKTFTWYRKPNILQRLWQKYKEWRM